MKEVFLFTSGLIIGIFIGLNLKPKPKSMSNSLLSESFPNEYYCKKYRYHY